jgi:spore germination cell wall hydrolase CwlJ-like protein
MGRIAGVIVGAALITVQGAASAWADTPVQCMAEAIEHEAGNQPLLGKLAVGVVIKNRQKDPRWPDTICEVVRQGHFLTGRLSRDVCQFSFYCDGRLEKAGEESIILAKLILDSNLEIEGLTSATHYHADYVYPRWRSQVVCKTQIGAHIFCATKQ